MKGENNESPPAEPHTRRVRPDESTAIAVVRTVAELLDTPSVDLDPLGESIDTDALDDVVQSGEDVDVAFDYAGTRVIVNERTVTARIADD